MNSDTGKVYFDDEAMRALARGEKLVPVSERVAQFVKTARESKVKDLLALCTCTHRARHHFLGSRRPCKYRTCGCKAFRRELAE